MNQMQAEIETQVGDGPLQILGVNEDGHAGSNAAMCEGRVLPWLQDRAEVDVWKKLWKPVYRDVVILDGDGRVHAVYNVTEHDLNNPANYAALKTLLLEAIAALP